ncbi:MAG TPA: amino acid permease [Gemmatimonadaceae bacterium]|nr:amino acid permease [Gemmatimonadaceae bacterium]
MNELRRSIGLVRATAIVVGIIIGASIFVQPSQVTGAISSETGVLGVWLMAGLLTLIGALVIAELSSAWPQTGGVYVFLKNAYSPVVGFLWGWAMFWTMHTGIVAIIAMVCARYVGSFIELSDTGIRVVAIVAVAVLSAVNYVGVKQASAVQATLTLIKVAACILIVGMAFLAGGSPAAAAGTAMPNVTLPRIVTAMIAGLFAFGGWHMVSYSAEETINPTKTIPRALVLGTLTVTVLYVALNASYLHVLSVDQVSKSTRVAADLADAVFHGGNWARIVSFFVILSTLGAANGVILAGPRVYLAMAQDGMLFKQIAHIHPVFRTPSRAVVLQGIWAAVLIATNSYRTLFTRVVYTEWIFFAMLAGALYFLRRRAGYAPAYRFPGFRVWCAIFVASSATIVITEIVTKPQETGTGLLLVLSGLPVYYFWSRKRLTFRS